MADHHHDLSYDDIEMDVEDDMHYNNFSLYLYSDTSSNSTIELDDSHHSNIDPSNGSNNENYHRSDYSLEFNEENNQMMTNTLIYFQDDKEYCDKEAQTCNSLLEEYIELKCKTEEIINLASDDSYTCTICLEAWTLDTEHRLVSLKCGHLFGESCILRWILEAGKEKARCPSCNAKIKVSHIRRIYTKTISVGDKNEINKALKQVAEENKKSKQLLEEIQNIQNSYKAILAEVEKTKKSLIEEERELELLRSNKINNIAASHKANTLRAQSQAFKHRTTLDLNNGECRVLASSDILGVMIATQKNGNVLFDEYGLRKISTVDFRVNEFIPIHKNPIKDICFHPHDALVLSASVDKSIKLTNLMSCNIVMTQKLEADAWSCCWNLRNRNYFYVGLRTGKIIEYDMRVNNSEIPINEIIGPDKVPVSSLQYLIYDDEPIEGIFATHLKSCNFHSKLSDKFESIQLNISGNFISAHFDRKSSNLLLSSRPNKNQTNVNHSIYQLSLNDKESTNISLMPQLISTFNGGKRADQFLRSKIFLHPNDVNSSLIAAGDQDMRGCLIWDLSSKTKLQEIKCNSVVFDNSFMRLSNADYILASLTEKKIFIHKWSL